MNKREYESLANKRIETEFPQLIEVEPNIWTTTTVVRECLIGLLVYPKRDQDSKRPMFGEVDAKRYLNISGRLCNKRLNGRRLSVAWIAEMIRSTVPQIEFELFSSDYYGAGAKGNKRSSVEMSLPQSLIEDLHILKLKKHDSKDHVSNQSIAHSPSKILSTTSPLDGLQRKVASKTRGILRRSKDALSRRLYHTEDDSLANEPKEFRQEVLHKRAYVSFDVASSQPAQVAVEWNLPLLFQALRSGDVWDALKLEKLGSKMGLMRLIFGGDFRRAGWDVLDAWDDTGPRKFEYMTEIAKMHERKFLTHPAMKEVYTNAQERIRHIMKTKNVKMKKARSMLACETQDREFVFVAETLCDWLDEHPGIDIVLWLHDGFTLDMSHLPQDEQDRLSADLIARFKRSADARGWPTSLKKETYEP